MESQRAGCDWANKLNWTTHPILSQTQSSHSIRDSSPNPQPRPWILPCASAGLLESYSTQLWVLSLRSSQRHMHCLENKHNQPEGNQWQSPDNITQGTFPVVQWLRLHLPNAGGLGLITGQETRYHMPQLRVLRQKKSCAYRKTWHSQMNFEKSLRHL